MKASMFGGPRLTVFAFALSALVPACGGSQSAPAAAPAPEGPPAAPAPAAAAPAAPAPAPAAAPAAASAPAPAPAPEAKEHHEHGRGMAAMFKEALAELTLTPEQKKTVDGVTATLDPLMAKGMEANKQLMADIADGVATGKIDHAKTDADLKAVLEMMKANPPIVQKGVNDIHKTLTPEQRKQVAASLLAKGQAMRDHMMEEGGPHGDHGGKPEDAAKGKDEHGGGHGMMMMKLAADLGLTDDQKKKLEKAMEEGMKAHHEAMKAKMADMEKRLKTMTDAFATDKFDAKKAGVAEPKPDEAKKKAADHIKFAETVLGVLTPDQRAKFAAHLREHAAD